MATTRSYDERTATVPTPRSRRAGAITSAGHAPLPAPASEALGQDLPGRDGGAQRAHGAPPDRSQADVAALRPSPQTWSGDAAGRHGATATTGPGAYADDGGGGGRGVAATGTRPGPTPSRRPRRPRGHELVVTSETARAICRRRAAGEGSADIGHDLDLDPLQVLDIAAGRATVRDT